MLNLADIQTFVKTAYLAVLNRAADQSGLDFYTNFVQSGQGNFTDVLKSLLTSSERARLALSSTSTYDFSSDTQFASVRGDEIIYASRELKEYTVMSLDQFTELFKPFSYGTYYNTHHVRFLEMINAVSYIQSKRGARCSILEFGSVFTSEMLLKALPETNLSTLDFLIRDELNGRVTEQYVLDLMKIDLRDKSASVTAELQFDAILCCEVIEHLIVNPALFLTFMLNSIVSGGYIYLTTPNFFKRQNVSNMIARYNPQPIFPEEFGPTETFHFHVREYGMGELISAVHSAGGKVAAYYFSGCWDDPLLVESTPPYELGNLVLLVQKP